MDLKFNATLASKYKSNSQIARVLSEDWVQRNSYCPNCGNDRLRIYKRNNPAADFFCDNCKFDFELKSFKSLPKHKIIDGAYSSMMNKIYNNTNPNFFLLQYSPNLSVVNFFTIPRYFITLNIIEKRKPLSLTARRANWVGCNILFSDIPRLGLIHLIKDSSILDRKRVLVEWEKTAFLSQRKIENRGWLVEMMKIVENIAHKTFNIQEIYIFEEVLKQKYPNNKFVKEKIRQQLQVLRDKGIIQFLGNGNYQKGS